LTLLLENEKIIPMSRKYALTGEKAPNSKLSHRSFYGFLALLTLITGLLIYLLFRNVNNILLFNWIPKPQFLDTVLIPLKPTLFTNILRYNLPDMLWFVSAILCIRFVWFYHSQIQKVYIAGFYAIVMALEISQLSEKIPGTFDVLDLVFMGSGAFFESLIFNLSTKRRIVCLLKGIGSPMLS
jgi:hypothetical protein